MQLKSVHVNAANAISSPSIVLIENKWQNSWRQIGGTFGMCINAGHRLCIRDEFPKLPALAPNVSAVTTVAADTDIIGSSVFAAKRKTRPQSVDILLRGAQQIELLRQHRMCCVFE